jgi:hypothetical protein
MRAAWQEKRQADRNVTGKPHGLVLLGVVSHRGYRVMPLGRHDDRPSCRNP